MENWYVLFVRTGSEDRVAKLLAGNMNTEAYFPFVPKKAYPHIIKGNVIKKMKICFPGYVFVQSDNDATLLIEEIVPVVALIKDAYRFLTYGGDKEDMAMREHERAGIKKFMDGDFVMDGSLGFVEGDHIRIVEGPLAGLESHIKKLRKRKRTVVVEILLMGQMIETTLMLELVEKIYTENPPKTNR